MRPVDTVNSGAAIFVLCSSWISTSQYWSSANYRTAFESGTETWRHKECGIERSRSCFCRHGIRTFAFSTMRASGGNVVGYYLRLLDYEQSSIPDDCGTTGGNGTMVS